MEEKKKKKGEDSHVSSLQTWSLLAHCLDGLHSPVLHKARLRKHESLQGLLFLRRHCFFLSEHSPSSSHLLGSGEIYYHMALIPSTLILGEWMSL